tara:strand:- start:484 stop:636 length:153 start_codon:yes stop_codon:yes gene_type:complete
MLIKGKYIKPSTIKRERVYKEYFKEYEMDHSEMKLPEERERNRNFKKTKI